MVRTYWFVLGFNEASSNLDLQPFARVDHVEACRPRAWECPLIVRGRARLSVMMMPVSERSYDAIVLGAGPVGRGLRGPPGRRRAAKVAIVERDLVGGECSYYACMPSKALLRPADVLAEAKRIPGVPTGHGELEAQAVLARRDEVIHDRDDSGQLPWLEEREIDLFRGSARFDGERRVARRRRHAASPRGRSSSPPAARRRCRRSRASTRSTPGTTATRPPPSRCRRA